MTRHRRWLIVAVLAAAGWSAVTTDPAGAQGHDGVCTDALGVTVVVDFHDLGGGVNVRCAPWSPGMTGFGVLQAAGVQYQTAARFPGFLCKIAGRPVDERCIDTSPATAYWSYWLASRGGQWCYSNWGAGNRQATPGSVEAWSFSSQRSASAAPPPRFAVPPAAPGAPARPLADGDCDPGRTPPGPTVPTPPAAPTPPTTPPPVASPGPHSAGGATGGTSAAPSPGDPPAAHTAPTDVADESTDRGSTPAAGGSGGSDGSTTTVTDDAPDVEGADVHDADSTAMAGSAEDADVHGERTGAAASRDEATAGLVDLSGGARTSSPIGALLAVSFIVVVAACALVRTRRRAVDSR